MKLPERRSYRGGQKSEEVAAIETFLQGTAKNMCFTYDNDADAKRRLGTLGGWRRKSPDSNLIDIFRNGTRIYVVRLSPKEVKARRTPT